MAPGQCRCQWHGAHLPWFCSVRVQLGRSPPCRLRGSESVGRIVSAWAGSFFTAKCLQSWVRLRNPVIRAIRPGPGPAAVRPGALAAAHQTPPGKPQPARVARVRVIRTATVPVTVTIIRLTGPDLRHTTSPSESAPRPTEPRAGSERPAGPWRASRSRTRPVGCTRPGQAARGVHAAWSASPHGSVPLGFQVAEPNPGFGPRQSGGSARFPPAGPAAAKPPARRRRNRPAVSGGRARSATWESAGCVRVDPPGPKYDTLTTAGAWGRCRCRIS